MPSNFAPVRRDLLKFAAAGLLSGVSVPWFEALAREYAAPVKKQPRACILLWMDGGQSQQHTFDPREDGQFKPIASAVPGIQIVEHLPKLAALMNDVALIRGMTTAEGEHDRAKYQMHTGYKQMANASHPALGSIAARELELADSPLPGFVTIDAGQDGVHGATEPFRNSPSYLGPQYAPVEISDPEKGLDLLMVDESSGPLATKLKLLQQSERQFAAEPLNPVVAARQAALARAASLLQSPEVRNVADVTREPNFIRDSYGRHRFGQSCLLARRLVEAGVRFVEVFHRGWDDHSGTAQAYVKRLPWFDTAVAALILDLKQRGLLESTLVLCMGEFGRAPGDGGAHFAQAWSMLLAGAGLKTGQAIGRTDASGREIADRPVTAPDLFATILRALRVDAVSRTHADERPRRYVGNEAKVIEELF